MQHATGIDMHSGRTASWIDAWSHDEPVTVFGAGVRARVGWDDVHRTITWVAGAFGDCQDYEYELVAADVRGDLAYTCGFERYTATRPGGEIVRNELRVTQVCRRRSRRPSAAGHRPTVEPDGAWALWSAGRTSIRRRRRSWSSGPTTSRTACPWTRPSALGDAVRQLRDGGLEVVVAPAPDLSAVPHVPAQPTPTSGRPGRSRPTRPCSPRTCSTRPAPATP
ncbi:ketosteroid isomerase-like protein [Marmoricola bigeumensis]|uniref:Ketosteroid isomerase-like protein n=1 Tax=Nocardioides marmoribigeumensis TaxID=433649 RepID=A0ABU2BTA4_9ACTN|nr:ketosteroid isomerase-like protein [Nocardioides marmoribigeumensis]